MDLYETSSPQQELLALVPVLVPPVFDSPVMFVVLPEWLLWRLLIRSLTTVIQSIKSYFDIFLFILENLRPRSSSWRSDSNGEKLSLWPTLNDMQSHALC